MIEWDETQAAVREAIRKFVDDEVKPRRDALEREEVSPYDVLRKFFAAFGVGDMGRARGEAEAARAQA